jgi:opacity protein-like surface antigen
MKGSRYLLLTTVGLLLPLSAQAQYAESEPGELSVFAGTTMNTGVHPYVGATAGLDFGKYAIGLFDVAFTHLGSDTLRQPVASDVKDSHLYDFNYSVHIRYPIKEKWAPYAILGPSVLWNSYSYGLSTSNGAKVYRGRDDVNFGWHTGGGFRYNVNDSWGIRPEVKVIITTRTYVVFSLGVFFKTPCCI